MQCRQYRREIRMHGYSAPRYVPVAKTLVLDLLIVESNGYEKLKEADIRLLFIILLVDDACRAVCFGYICV